MQKCIEEPENGASEFYRSYDTIFVSILRLAANKPVAFEKCHRTGEKWRSTKTRFLCASHNISNKRIARSSLARRSLVYCFSFSSVDDIFVYILLFFLVSFILSLFQFLVDLTLTSLKIVFFSFVFRFQFNGTQCSSRTVHHFHPLILSICCVTENRFCAHARISFRFRRFSRDTEIDWTEMSLVLMSFDFYGFRTMHTRCVCVLCVSEK